LRHDSCGTLDGWGNINWNARGDTRLPGIAWGKHTLELFGAAASSTPVSLMTPGRRMQ